MIKLEKFIELNSLEKQNRRNRSEDKLKQEEYYCEIEELFDPLTKTLNTNNETMQAYNETWQVHAATMQALQNNSLAALADTISHQRRGSFLDERASLLSFTRDPPVTIKDD